MGFLNQYQDRGEVKLSGQKEALDTLQKLAKDTTKGLVEDTEVYQKAKNIAEEHPYLIGTINAIVNQELGVSFDVGENKEIGFSVNPEKKQAQLGFKMSFAKAGAVGTGGELTFQQAFKDRIAEMQRKLDAGGRMSQGEIDKANRTYARLFGGTHTKRTYKSVLQDVFPDRKVSEILFSEVNTSEIQKQIYTKAQNQVWYKGKYGAAMDFQKQISGAIGNVVGSGKTASAFNAAAPYKNSELVLQGGKPGRGPVLDEDIYRNTVKQINKIKDASARRLAKIMLLQGIRETDLVRIKVSDIDFVNNTIKTISKKVQGHG